MILPLVLFATTCAHTPPTVADMVLLDPEGVPLDVAPGPVTVVELCASWADACLFNLRSLDELCKLRCGERVRAISVVLDDPAAPAIHSYREVFKVSQEIAVLAPEARGIGSEIPAVLIFDTRGVLVDDVRGGIVDPGRMITRVDALLARGR